MPLIRPNMWAGMAANFMRPQAHYARPLAGDSPIPWLGEFHGTDDTISLMLQYARGPEGEQNVKVRQYAEAIVKQLRPKDYLGEIIAIRHWCTAPRLRYANDARHVEQVKSPFRVLTEIEQYGVSNLDCDDYATLIAALGMTLGREARFTMVGFGLPGDYTHVFACLKEPRSGEWIICDPVAGTREHVMASTAKTYKHISVDD
jgi:hypothetical protein